MSFHNNLLFQSMILEDIEDDYHILEDDSMLDLIEDMLLFQLLDLILYDILLEDIEDD